MEKFATVPTRKPCQTKEYVLLCLKTSHGNSHKAHEGLVYYTRLGRRSIEANKQAVEMPTERMSSLLFMLKWPKTQVKQTTGGNASRTNAWLT